MWRLLTIVEDMGLHVPRQKKYKGTPWKDWLIHSGGVGITLADSFYQGQDQPGPKKNKRIRWLSFDFLRTVWLAINLEELERFKYAERNHY